MKETISAYDLPQTEMKKVHGHTRIVLRNSASGHIVKDVESENTFQSDILAGLYENIPYLNQNNNRSWADTVGGLFLFKDSITLGSRFMNAGNVMIGNGYRDATNSSTPLELGSFNSIDSYARYENGVPTIFQVWDFNNNQSNGRISSVCLTSKIGSAIGYGNSSGAFRDSGYNVRSFSQDNTEWNETFDDSDITFRFYVNSNGSVTVTEIKRNSIKGSGFSGLSGSYTLTPETAFSGSIVAGDVPSFNVGNHKIRFVPHGARTYATGTSVQYYEFDTHDKTIEIKTFTNNSGRTIGTHTSTIYAYFYATFTFTRFNKVICMDHSSWADLLVFDLSDSSYKLVHGDNRRLFTGNGNFDAGEFSEDLILIHED